MWIDTDSDESLRAFLLFYLTTEGTEVKMVATAVFARGKGIARDLLRQVVGPAQTWIRVENKPSQALFSSSGWVYAYVADGWQRWVLTGEE